MKKNYAKIQKVPNLRNGRWKNPFILKLEKCVEFDWTKGKKNLFRLKKMHQNPVEIRRKGAFDGALYERSEREKKMMFREKDRDKMC